MVLIIEKGQGKSKIKSTASVYHDYVFDFIIGNDGNIDFSEHMLERRPVNMENCL